MNWKSLFAADINMDSTDVKSFIAAHKPEEYTLLDVRHLEEYAEEHLPGATLIPLPELPDRLTELDQSKPVFVY